MEHRSSPAEPRICVQRCMNDASLDLTGTEIPLRKKEERLPFQIFPDPVDSIPGHGGTLASTPPGKERLPSIVVEPTEVSEVESGELRWPPEHGDPGDEEDLFLEQCIPPANIADWAEDEESFIISDQPGASLLDLQPDDYRDDTPTLPPESAPVPN